MLSLPTEFLHFSQQTSQLPIICLLLFLSNFCDHWDLVDFLCSWWGNIAIGFWNLLSWQAHSWWWSFSSPSIFTLQAWDCLRWIWLDLPTFDLCWLPPPLSLSGLPFWGPTAPKDNFFSSSSSSCWGLQLSRHLLVFPLRPVPSVRRFLHMTLFSTTIAFKLLLFQLILRVISWIWFCRVLTAWLRIFLIFLLSLSTLIITFSLLLFVLFRSPLGSSYFLSPLTSRKPISRSYPTFCWTLTLGICYPHQTLNLYGSPWRVRRVKRVLFTPRTKNKPRSCPIWFNCGIHHQLNCIQSMRKCCKDILLLIIFHDFLLLNFNSKPTF